MRRGRRRAWQAQEEEEDEEEREEEVVHVAPTLMRAVENGASVEALREMIAGMQQAEVEERDLYRKWNALHVCIYRQPEVFELVLDAMSRQAIEVENFTNCDVLHHALWEGKKEAVLLLAERQRREKDWDIFGRLSGGMTRVEALFRGSLINDRQMVDLLAELVPAEHWGLHAGEQYGLSARTFGSPAKGEDVLVLAIRAQLESSYAVDVCLQCGPSMERRLKRLEETSVSRLYYVGLAAEWKDLSMVEKLHGAVPMLPDGSCSRASEEDYAEAICKAAGSRDREQCLAKMEYLAEAGGMPNLEAVPHSILRQLKKKEEFQWVLRRAPHLLADACASAQVSFGLYLTLRETEAREYLVDEILALVDRDVIRQMLEQAADMAYQVGGEACHNWKCSLRRLSEEVPGVWRERAWEMLMMDVQYVAYDDVEFMLSMCSKADLARRNDRGDRAADVAERDPRFPKELLGRLAVVTKNANT